MVPKVVGYTVIEVLIVLGISGLIFVSGMVLLAGQSNEAAFTHSVQDINSEINFRIRETATNQFFNSQGYQCGVSGSPPRATLSASGSSTGGNEDCIVIGTAMDAIPGTSDIYFYKVLGNRQVYGSGNVPSGAAASLDEANPTVASAACCDLTFKYKLASDVRIVSSTATTGGGNLSTNLVGFYIDFSGEVRISQTRAQSLVAKAYNYQAASHDATAVKNCVEGTACTSPAGSSLWKICFSNAAGDRQAEIGIYSLPTGVTTDLKFINCT